MDEPAHESTIDNTIPMETEHTTKVDVDPIEVRLD